MLRLTDTLVLVTIAFAAMGIGLAQMRAFEPKGFPEQGMCAPPPVEVTLPLQWAILPAEISIATRPARRVWRMNLPSSALGRQVPPAWAAMITGLVLGGLCLLDHHLFIMRTNYLTLLPPLVMAISILTLYQTLRNLCPDAKLAS